MRQLLLPVTVLFLSACASTPIPPVDPHQAWVDFATPTPGAKLVMAQRLDGKNLNDGRFFQVPPGSHELMVRFDFEVNTGTGFGGLDQTHDRTCFMTLQYDKFQAGQRYVLEGRSLAFTPNIRLYNSARQLLAQERSVNCI
ncbi:MULTISPECIES: PA0061/PA0062 family lipoprotein [Pseudomonas]|uniref:PA0061/PA0062 family lipoprotein n=1 Tax=Pseudomonas antarctica TaxID=219572 RepID=UPI00345CCAB8